MAFSTGDRVVPYESSGLLGGGGATEVRRARGLGLDRETAVATPPTSLASDPIASADTSWGPAETVSSTAPTPWTSAASGHAWAFTSWSPDCSKREHLAIVMIGTRSRSAQPSRTPRRSPVRSRQPTRRASCAAARSPRIARSLDWALPGGGTSSAPRSAPRRSSPKVLTQRTQHPSTSTQRPTPERPLVHVARRSLGAGATGALPAERVDRPAQT